MPVVRWILGNFLCLKRSALSTALRLHLPVARPVLGMLLLACQIALRFSVPSLKAEPLRFWLSPRRPSSRHREGAAQGAHPKCSRSVAWLSSSSIKEAVPRAAGIAVPVLTSSGGEDGGPKSPGSPQSSSGAVWMCGRWPSWVCWASPSWQGRPVRVCPASPHREAVLGGEALECFRLFHSPTRLNQFTN